MATYRVRVEYALAFDLDLEVEALETDDALDLAQGAVDHASILEAIRSEFAGLHPSIAGSDVIVTDIRVVHTDGVEVVR